MPDYIAVDRKRHDDHGGIECSDRLDAQKLETQSPLHCLPEGHDTRLRGAAELSRLRPQSLAFTGELLRVPPGQTDPRPAASIRKPVECEFRETEPLWKRV